MNISKLYSLLHKTLILKLSPLIKNIPRKRKMYFSEKRLNSFIKALKDLIDFEVMREFWAFLTCLGRQHSYQFSPCRSWLRRFCHRFPSAERGKPKKENFEVCFFVSRDGGSLDKRKTTKTRIRTSKKNRLLDYTEKDIDFVRSANGGQIWINRLNGSPI